jgi:thioredoxin 1
LDVDDELTKLRERRLAELKSHGPPAPVEGPTVVTDATLESFVKSHKIAMVDVWAIWCGPCRIVEPVVEDLAKEWVGRAGVGKLDADSNYESVMRYGVQGIPAFLFFKDGKLVGRLVGARPKRDFNEALRQVELVSSEADPSVQ